MAQGQTRPRGPRRRRRVHGGNGRPLGHPRFARARTVGRRTLRPHWRSRHRLRRRDAARPAHGARRDRRPRRARRPPDPHPAAHHVGGARCGDQGRAPWRHPRGHVARRQLQGHRGRLRPEGGSQTMIALTFVDRVWRWSRDEGLQIVLIVLGTLLAVRVVRWVIGRVDARMSKRQPSDTLVLTEEAKRRNALLGVMTYVGVILVWAVGVFMMLERLGVNTGPLVASAGVLGLAVGFGAQSLVKDLVSGFFILAEGHYGVGDNIEINTNNDL